jgi:predicted ATPase
MISQIDIKNFKSLKDVSTDTKKLNLLMGLNGMGKSSFLQMILLLMQSDKLENRIIDLNGILAQIGQGKDALYQFAIEDHIEFGIKFDESKEFNWKFNYHTDKDKLTAETGYTKDDMYFFRDKTKLFQYISAERIGPKDLYDASSVVVSDKKQLGLLGEYAAYFINVFGAEYEVKKSLHHPKGKTDSLNSQINAWLKEISPGVSINTKYVPEANKVILDYQFDIIGNKTNSFRPKNVGFGISYVLPIVLALLTVEKDKIIVIENPESHIHPRGQVELGKLIALAAKSEAQIFIETHSDHILNGIRVAVKERMIDKSDVNLLYFDKITDDKESYTNIHEIKIDDNGTLSNEPEGLLDEWGNQLLKLL